MHGFSLVLDVKAALGECPLWCTEDKVLYFVDIKQCRIHRYDPISRDHSSVLLPEEVSCIGLAKGGGFVAGLRSGIWLVGTDGQVRRKLADNPENLATSRFNDGTVDPAGRFVAGTVDETRAEGTAALYCLSSSGLRLLRDGLLTSNGTAFSPDGTTLYHSDTLRYVVYAHDYDLATGTISGTRDFIRFHPKGNEKGRPDGAAVDVEGCYWTALFEGSRVQRYAPDGRLLAEFPVPAFCPTMVAFGGDDRRTLFVTSARSDRSTEELEAYPQSGGLFAMTVDVPGLEKPLFDVTAR
ncbi:SMP-30/gluconolactonase/LRE family protein [Devosia sp. PTR5]|uniref:SMP-30/gluconolactonase/LRE family protein n=1 Tax=Devosia oryzisoli TaxID=2774138 RepID=A0A927FV27_9HYPH|nr:SMP-30/gluconolactonase/LRE family protein [Devosia oryzisoli]MBD8065892.1 SMP-30/gluconolactonase/LRE family protein [Devosia oryzisoli]